MPQDQYVLKIQREAFIEICMKNDIQKLIESIKTLHDHAINKKGDAETLRKMIEMASSASSVQELKKCIAEKLAQPDADSNTLSKLEKIIRLQEISS